MRCQMLLSLIVKQPSTGTVGDISNSRPVVEYAAYGMSQLKNASMWILPGLSTNLEVLQNRQRSRKDVRCRVELNSPLPIN